MITGYNCKGTLAFWIMIILIISAIISGGDVLLLILYLLAGMAGYWIINWIIKAVSGFNPHTGERTVSQKEINEVIEKQKQFDDKYSKEHEERQKYYRSLKKYKCNFCLGKFKTKTGLNDHIKRKHQNKKNEIDYEKK